MRVPRHVAIIMDGNGRWAERRGLPRTAGHRAGVKPVRTVVEECARRGVAALTLFAFSSENFKRPVTEVGLGRMSMRPALSLEKSRISSRRLASEAPEPRIAST